jgi:hypothetical protein
MPEDHPNAFELIETVAEHLGKAVRPALAGHAAFEALLAAHLLTVARRELELGPAARAEHGERLRQILGMEGSVEALEHRLVAMIRCGELGPRRPGVVEDLRRTTEDRLRIANPNYLRER